MICKTMSWWLPTIIFMEEKYSYQHLWDKRKTKWDKFKMSQAFVPSALYYHLSISYIDWDIGTGQIGLSHVCNYQQLFKDC